MAQDDRKRNMAKDDAKLSLCENAPCKGKRAALLAAALLVALAVAASLAASTRHLCHGRCSIANSTASKLEIAGLTATLNLIMLSDAATMLKTGNPPAE